MPLSNVVDSFTDFIESDAVQSGIDTMKVSGQVYNITNNKNDAAVAAGYSAWIKSITGSDVTVSQKDSNRAALLLTEPQVKQMQQWTEDNISTILKPGKVPPTLEIDLGPVFKPVAIKYLLPALIGVFALGFISHYFIYR